MTDLTAKTTTEARRLEALSVKTRLLPPKSELGPPMKKFSETLSVWTVIRDHFRLNKPNQHGDHE